MSDIDEVKSRLNIVDVIGERVTLKKAGHHFKALCPFHHEKTPSFVVSPERNMWKCFGCGKGGSVIDFVMEYEHVDFVEALEELAQKAGVKLERHNLETPEGKLKEKIYEVNHLASEYYHYILTKHPLGERGRLYLKSRGVTDKSIKTFMLGYSPNSWDGLTKYLRKKGYDEKLLETSGLLVRGTRTGYDRFRGRIMFTLKDHRGNVAGFSGRVLDPDIKEAKYINTSETPAYSKSNMLFGLDVTKNAIQAANEAIIMEGELDVISSFQEGVSNVVAIKGSALTEGHVNLLKRFTERLLFCLDSDLAGDAASRRGIEIADRAGLDMRIIVLPQGKDPDEAARTNPGLFKKAIEKAIPIYDYFISSALKRYDAGSAYGKKKISEEILPVLGSIENGIVQGHYMKELAISLDVGEDVIRESLDKLKRGKAGAWNKKTGEEIEIQGPVSRLEKLELFILALLLQSKTADFFPEFRDSIDFSDIGRPAIRQILHLLDKFLKDHPVFLIRDFADSLPKELLPTLDEAYLFDVADILDDEDRLLKEWTKALAALRYEVIRRKITGLTRIVHDASGADFEKIQTELGKLTAELKVLEKAG